MNDNNPKINQSYIDFIITDRAIEQLCFSVNIQPEMTSLENERYIAYVRRWRAKIAGLEKTLVMK